MERKIREFYGSVKKDRANSEWAKKHSLETRHEELRKEVEELGEAIREGSARDIKDEMGDVLFDFMACAVIAEEAGIFDIKDVMEHANAKLKRRKPWVFDGRKLSQEEERDEYKKIKRRER